ncbi:hypothetical protein GQ457_05G019920 [Hibiscus cannabinus]
MASAICTSRLPRSTGSDSADPLNVRRHFQLATHTLKRENRMSSSRSGITYGEVDLPLECDTENLVGRWGESLDDFSEDDENIVPINEDDEFELLDADDVNILRTGAVEGNDLDVEDDVWAADVAKLGLVEDPIVWGFVQTEPIVEDVWANVVARMKLVDEPVAWGYVQPGPNQSAHILEDTMTAYEPPAHMHEVDYDAMRDPEYEARAFASSSVNYDELALMTQFETKKDAQVAVKEYCIKRHMKFCVVESDTSTYCVRCVNYKAKCQWKIRISYLKRKKMWEVTSSLTNTLVQ